MISPVRTGAVELSAAGRTPLSVTVTTIVPRPRDQRPDMWRVCAGALGCVYLGGVRTVPPRFWATRPSLRYAEPRAAGNAKRAPIL